MNFSSIPFSLHWTFEPPFALNKSSSPLETCKPPDGATPRPLNLTANEFQPKDCPFPSGKIMLYFFYSISQTEQRMNLSASFKRRSNLYFLFPSSQPIAQSWLLTSPQQASTPSNKHRKLASPNLIQEETPLLLSQMQTFSFPPNSSTKISKDLDSTTKQLLPPLATPASPHALISLHHN